MSAFMFVMRDSSIKAMTDQELAEQLTHHQAIVDGVDWDKFEMCNFKYDQASGSRANVHKIKQELEQRKNGANGPLDRVMVPGYNPAPETGPEPVEIDQKEVSFFGKKDEK